MPDVSKAERQVYILALLSENPRGFTIEEIMKSLYKEGIEVSQKTIKRDIDAISRHFFVYEEGRGKETIYLAKKYCLKNITFTFPELISLHFVRQVLTFYQKLDIGKTAAQIIEKIIAATPHINRNYLNNLSDFIKVNVVGINEENEVDSEHLETLKKAIEEKKCVQIEYHSFNNDEMTKREFEPYLLEIYEGCWHVVGYCRLRKKIREFRVSRIKSIALTEEFFERPENFYEDYKKNRFNKLSGEESVFLRLLFTGRAARYVEEYESSKADFLQKVQEGLIFERKAAMSPEILKWVLGFGAEVKVLEPASLKDEVVEQTKKMQSLYNLS